MTAVDTTGAGDVFNRVLAASLSLNVSVAHAILRANAAAAISVTRSGAIPPIPDALSIEAFLD